MGYIFEEELFTDEIVGFESAFIEEILQNGKLVGKNHCVLDVVHLAKTCPFRKLTP
jgi:hypothetical protein